MSGQMGRGTEFQRESLERKVKWKNQKRERLILKGEYEREREIGRVDERAREMKREKEETREGDAVQRNRIKEGEERDS